MNTIEVVAGLFSDSRTARYSLAGEHFSSAIGYAVGTSLSVWDGRRALLAVDSDPTIADSVTEVGFGPVKVRTTYPDGMEFPGPVGF